MRRRTHDSALAVGGLVEHRGQRGQLPFPANEFRGAAACLLVPTSKPSNSRPSTGSVNPFDRQRLRFRQHRIVCDKPCGRLTEHDPPDGAADSIRWAANLSPIAV